ncbi:MAG: PD40 domain-containing protein [Anaerolineae bacterium]|nr:PD40 domain-containing protein [Anaerolineae bacterium]
MTDKWALTIPGVVMAALLGLVAACGVVAPGNQAATARTPTADYAALETAVAIKLAATLTAKAPTPTHTPQPTLTPRPSATPTEQRRSPTPEPSPTATEAFQGLAHALAYVRITADDADNIVLRDLDSGEEQVLTHFTAQRNMSDLGWSQDGEWLVFVSSHDYISSRNNERNIFMMRANGTDLRMVTGDYMAPDEAPGPYAELSGRVLNAPSTCRVFAQGATGAVLTDEEGQFEIPGVSLSARWVRAVSQSDDILFEGDLDLVATGESFEPVSLTVEPRGQGWRQASLSPDNRIVAGTFYTWTLNAEGEMQTSLEGLLYDLETREVTTLQLPEEAILNGLAWSPRGDQVVGALTGEEGALLWLWDTEGASLGPLIEVAQPEDQLLSAAHPAWSPHGSLIAFELRRHAWWGDPQYRIDIMIASSSGESINALVESEWGADAKLPAWSADGSELFYQLSLGEPADEHQAKTSGDLWSVSLAQPTPKAWTEDGQSYLPALRPMTAR